MKRPVQVTQGGSVTQLQIYGGLFGYGWMFIPHLLLLLLSHFSRVRLCVTP